MSPKRNQASRHPDPIDQYGDKPTVAKLERGLRASLGRLLASRTEKSWSMWLEKVVYLEAALATAIKQAER